MRALLAVLGLLACATVGFGAGTFWVLVRGLPQVSALEEFVPPSSTRVYAADGSQLAEFATQKRIPVPLEEVPEDLVKAVLAIEDHRFFDHMGINLGRIAKALVADIRAGRIVEGASTITQQLAKVLFLTPEKTLTRKLREALLALEIERRHTKNEILTFYLNQIYLGNGAYGVAAAAKIYFDTPLRDLDLASCALLAALPKAPSSYDPFRNPERALARRNLVLDRMAALGWVPASATAAARAAPLPAVKPPAVPVAAPYFVETVRKRLLARLGLDLVYQGGLRVYTTLESDLQQAAETALTQALAELDGRHRKRAPTQGAVLALDPRSGAVRAQVGGRDWQESAYDRAVQAHRQPGSCYKVFTYLTALEQGHTQADLAFDVPVSYPGARPAERWSPSNYDGEFQGVMTLRKALALSRNVPAVRLMEQLGKRAVDQTAARLGLGQDTGQGLASALGVGSASLLELVRAYAALPAGGLLPEPHWIRAVYGPDGRNLWDPPAGGRRVLAPTTAYLGADMLRGVVEHGTGKQARALPFWVGGKTGTTDDMRDAWFVGFSSRLALGVWVGKDDNEPLGWGETGARAALPAWIDTMLAGASGGPPPPWTAPPGVSFVEIDLVSGRRSTELCSDTAYAAFDRGSEPRGICDRESVRPEVLAARFGFIRPLRNWISP